MKRQIRVFSRHPSHKVLRDNLPKVDVRAIVRLGSSTQTPNNGHQYIEINDRSVMQRSSNKIIMKSIFTQLGIPTPNYIVGFQNDSGALPDGGHINELTNLFENEFGSKDINYPIVAKYRYGSRGRGNTLLKNREELSEYLAINYNALHNTLFEEYKNYLYEYRLHVTPLGCFYTCRKAIKRDAVDNGENWRRHVDNSVWLKESNPLFYKPKSWDNIVKCCVQTLLGLGADLLSFDVRVNKKGDFVILECNSASSLKCPNGGDISVAADRYLQIIPHLIEMKKEGLVKK